MELVPDNVMIVLAVSIGCYLVFFRGNASRRGVVECHTDNGLHAFHEQPRVEPFVLVVLHIGHAGLMAQTEPLAEKVGRERFDGFGLGDSTCKKAETFRLGFDVNRKFGTHNLVL